MPIERVTRPPSASIERRQSHDSAYGSEHQALTSYKRPAFIPHQKATDRHSSILAADTTARDEPRAKPIRIEPPRAPTSTPKPHTPKCPPRRRKAISAAANANMCGRFAVLSALQSIGISPVSTILHHKPARTQMSSRTRLS